MHFQKFTSNVKTRRLLGLSATDIPQELNSAYGFYALSYSFVPKWHNFFDIGRESIKDNPC